MGFSTRDLRGRPVTHEEAAKAVQRLINSHFHNEDRARCSIPARAEDDDLVASDYVEEATERIRELEAQLDDWKSGVESIALMAGMPREESWGVLDIMTHVREQREQLASLSWTPISEENLPTMGDEVVCGRERREVLRSDQGKNAHYWNFHGWTHKRPTNAPEREEERK